MVKPKIEKKKIILTAIVIFLLLFVIYLIIFKKDDSEFISDKFEQKLLFLSNDSSEEIKAEPDSLFAMAIPDSLIVNKGIYKICDKKFNISKEGLYRFIGSEKPKQFIVFKTELFTLISSLSWIAMHSDLDNKKSHYELVEKAKTSKLFLSCFFISRFTVKLLNSFGYEARLLAGITLDEWNNYDNGHNLIEVFFQKYNKWIVFDIDKNVCFKIKDDYLSYLELVNNLFNPGLKIDRIAGAYKIDYVTDNNCNMNDVFFTEFKNNNLLNWYRRVLQVPLIFSENNFFFYNKSDTNRIKSYQNNFQYIDSLEYIYKFYRAK